MVTVGDIGKMDLHGLSVPMGGAAARADATTASHGGGAGVVVAARRPTRVRRLASSSRKLFVRASDKARPGPDRASDAARPDRGGIGRALGGARSS
jgi:hypothetical protein